MNNFKKNAIRNVLIMTVLAAPITVHAQEAEDVAALVATQSVAETA